MSAPTYSKAMGVDETTGQRPTVDAPFGTTLTEIAGTRPDIVGLTADLGKYTDILPFADAFPERFFNVGMAEQNLIGIAAGLARTGFVPFATTYGVFATRRAYDYIAIACAHSRVNVKIIAGLPGLTTGYGGTHQAIEDVGLMCMIPELVVLDPCDATELTQVVRAVADIPGTVYVRLLRGKVPVELPSDYTFVPGKAALLRDGTGVGVISTGPMSARALDAARAAIGSGVDAAVLHVPTIKPFDSAAVLEFAHRFDRLVVAENHKTTGGLATLVTETLYDAGLLRPLIKVGLADEFFECGSQEYLEQKYGVDLPRLVRALVDGV